MIAQLPLALAVVWVAGQDAGSAPLLAENLAAVRKIMASHDQVWPETIDTALHKAMAARDVDSIIGAVASGVFLEVTINPEGRVRVARGEYTPALKQDQPRYALVKVNNQSGGQQRLSVRVACLAAEINPFDLAVDATAPFGADLRGYPVEYRLLKMTCKSIGQREATISFNAGQGTEDLGFRGETPVLFRISR